MNYKPRIKSLIPSNKNIELFFMIMFFIIIFIKFLFISLFLESVHSMGVDTIYYNDYALGLTQKPPTPYNSWAVTLKYLNSIGLYSRNVLAIIIAFLGNIIIPLQVASLSRDKTTVNNHYWLAIITISLYPSLFFFSLDILRDIPMLFLFLFGLQVLKMTLKAKQNSGSIFYILLLYIILIIIGYMLFSLRKYFGFAYFFALILCHFYSFYGKSFISIIIFGLFFISLAFLFSLFDPIINYRSGFSEKANGSTLGIVINPDDNILIFNTKLMLSFAHQVFGIYIYSKESFFLFATESIPFIGFFYLLIKRIKSSFDRFIDFLMLFFLSYSFIFVLGNDNLGTAIRLRIPCYIVIFIAFLLSSKRAG